MEVTILYYSASVEPYEGKIRENILENSNGLPIVSVTQKPINLGHNICVGIREKSYKTEFEQIRIGLEHIKTDYILVAEADTLYPPDYFNFKLDGTSDCYRYKNVWVYYADKDLPFIFKGYSHCAQIVNRKAWLDMIINNKNDKPPQFPTSECGRWDGEPVVTLKTREGVNYRTQTSSQKLPTNNLSYWGDIENFKRKVGI
jgi:hypothetical protein